MCSHASTALSDWPRGPGRGRRIPALSLVVTLHAEGARKPPTAMRDTNTRIFFFIPQIPLYGLKYDDECAEFQFLFNFPIVTIFLECSLRGRYWTDGVWVGGRPCSPALVLIYNVTTLKTRVHAVMATEPEQS